MCFEFNSLLWQIFKSNAADKKSLICLRIQTKYQTHDYNYFDCKCCPQTEHIDFNNRPKVAWSSNKSELGAKRSNKSGAEKWLPAISSGTWSKLDRGTKADYKQQVRGASTNFLQLSEHHFNCTNSGSKQRRWQFNLFDNILIYWIRDVLGCLWTMRAVLILTDINIIVINFLPLQHVSNSKIQLWKLKAGILEITDISFVFGSVCLHRAAASGR